MEPQTVVFPASSVGGGVNGPTPLISSTQTPMGVVPGDFYLPLVVAFAVTCVVGVILNAEVETWRENAALRGRQAVCKTGPGSCPSFCFGAEGCG